MENKFSNVDILVINPDLYAVWKLVWDNLSSVKVGLG